MLFLNMFSSATQYAIRAILYMSRVGKENHVTVEDIALALDLRKPFLAKILQQLSRNHLISSTKGRGGGFYLTGRNLKKKLKDVIICMEGENVLERCILGLPQCSDQNPCQLHSSYKLFRINIEKEISRSSLHSLVKQ